MAHVRNFTDLKAMRAAVLYQQDGANEVRKSHENPSVKKIYADFFEKPGSHKAHEILHTSYKVREHF
jgi:NADP-reducing hydrogenase subunit HndD